MNENGLTYYKFQSPYTGDITKFCSLTGPEIDNNFYVLEGRDVASLAVNGRYLTITFFNGDTVECEIAGIDPSGCGCYTAGPGIREYELEHENVIATDASLIPTTEDITVVGTQGDYSDGDVIPAGTNIQEIIESMLHKVIDVTATLPTSAIIFNDSHYDGQVLEVGSNVSLVLGHTYTDGTFTGNDGYDYSVGAGCVEGVTTYYDKTGNTVGTGTSATVHITNLDEARYIYRCSTEYSASTVTPVKNDGNDSDVSIASGTTARTSVSVTGKFKYYYGYVDTRYNNDYSDSITEQADITEYNLTAGYCESTNVIEEMSSSEGSEALVLVLPDGYDNITYTENSFGASITIGERWIERSTIAYTKGSRTTTYHVFILHSLYPITYKKITFGS